MASRITNNIMVRNYMGNMRTNLGSLSRSNQKLSTQRSFSKASENVSGASRALRVRRLLNDNDRYTDSVDSLSKRLDTADTCLRSLSGVYQDITNLVTQGMTDTLSEQDRAVVSQQITKLRDEALSIANTKVGDQYLFCSSGNAAASAPFAVNDDGKLCYNGNTTPIDELVTDSNGKPAVDNGDGTTTELAYNQTNYIDVGLGLTVNEAGGAIQVDSKSVVKSSLSGVEIYGYGTDDNGYPKNFYGLFDKLANDITAGKTTDTDNAFSALESSLDGILISLSDIGSDSNFLNDISSQLSEDKVSLQDLQNDVEGIDLAEEIMNNTEYEMAWTVTLQLGGQILPKSIFDFL